LRRQIHGLFATELRSPDGSTALVSDHGAHLLSWVPAGRSEVLFLSPRSSYGKERAIRGGVPVIFPQFAERGPGQRHGFARTREWRFDSSFTDADSAVARFVLTPAAREDRGWSFPYELGYEVRLSASALKMSLAVRNTSSLDWTFTAALHTYLQVDSMAQLRIDGLQGCAYLDQIEPDSQEKRQDGTLSIDDEIDRIYASVNRAVTVQDGDRHIVVEQQGFMDCVVWNPGKEKAGKLADLDEGDASRFVCVESAVAVNPVSLLSGHEWRGHQLLQLRG
jgi:glucose-6-phosphate 1-epimerase